MQTTIEDEIPTSRRMMGNGFSSHHKSGRFDRDHGYNDDDDFSNGDDVGDESGSSTVVLLSVKAVDANRRDVSPIPVTQFDEEEKRISFAEGETCRERVSSCTF